MSGRRTSMDLGPCSRFFTDRGLSAPLGRDCSHGPCKPGKAPMSVLVHRSPAIARAVCAPKKNGSPGAMCTQLRTCGHSRLPPLLA